MEDKKGLSNRIMNMKFMKLDLLDDPNKINEDDDNWMSNFTIGDEIDKKIIPKISVYTKPVGLVNKIYENARRTSNLYKKKKEQDLKLVKLEEIDMKEIRGKKTRKLITNVNNDKKY